MAISMVITLASKSLETNASDHFVLLIFFEFWPGGLRGALKSASPPRVVQWRVKPKAELLGFNSL